MRFSVLLTILLLVGIAPVSSATATATAVFAGGCFWCMESDFEKRAGVTSVTSGFTGGALKNPTYSGSHQGHFEAVEVTYDPAIVSYQDLLDLFWVNVDPFDDKGQFCDKGFSYRSAIFPNSAEERALAQQSKAKVEARFAGQHVYTEIRDGSTFWPVEEYHQDYYLKNPVRYKYYRWNCGRDQRLRQLWGSDSSPLHTD
ncbi:peptide-methionine (S)-S-oxide reductase MsrA [Candidatus Marimicrobium litorale]|uniref:Peptide methionine sulfoxide reductase MsrA n=1 Tax=Candidatus Marimicrobium litorale TaxID=2518991 RepID=A0ABT3T9E0_9GAMM|nr:peptide-methionine (S)-S-oxide reductase MsrA [Candidatus Marimicrobium litorale]MCX2978877.1 peptide-methionine (S)-S-oxide reductase [Candidatus Marimicrobium litorale]